MKLETLPDSLTQGLQLLSLEQLEQLSEDLLDFQTLPELVVWLWFDGNTIRHAIVLRVLAQHLGEPETTIQPQIQALSVPQLRQMAKDFLGWSSPTDLALWLASML